jgi:hypothetical protein
MTFPYLTAARVKLQERKNTCLRADHDVSEVRVGHFLAFMRQDPVLRSIAAELDSKAQQQFADVAQCVDTQKHRLRLPTSEADCAPFYWRLLQVYADPNPNVTVPGYTWVFGSGSGGFQDKYDDFINQTLVPLCNYLDERIDQGDLLLYMLCRFQRECAWFDQQRLQRIVSDSESGQLEASLDQELRRWLFREGYDYPFEKPRSPSGETDIVVWHGEKPLPVEVKVFDGQNRDARHISQGLWQAYRYATDYGGEFGYLVVFNTSNEIVAFDGSDPSAAVPAVTVGDRTVFAVVVNVRPATTTASKERPLATTRIPVPAGPA